MDNIIISNLNTEKIIEKIILDGKERLHILTDFDRTLTRAFVDGKLSPTVIAGLRNGNYLTPDYPEKATELFNYYHPIEIDKNIPLSQRSKEMHDWWKKHFELLVASGLDRNTLQTMVNENLSVFREGAKDFFEILSKKNIPIVIMSAGPADAIKMVFEKNTIELNNIDIIGDYFEFDENGKVLTIKEPLIHSLNKSEIALKSFPEVFDKVKQRKNVIVIGDNISDLGMLDGFDYDNVLKIGFLNERINEQLEDYKKVFDIIIINDGSMDYINNIILKI
jgi:5'-nucleotidase